MMKLYSKERWGRVKEKVKESSRKGLDGKTRLKV